MTDLRTSMPFANKTAFQGMSVQYAAMQVHLEPQLTPTVMH